MSSFYWRLPFLPTHLRVKLPVKTVLNQQVNLRRQHVYQVVTFRCTLSLLALSWQGAQCVELTITQPEAL